MDDIVAAVLSTFPQLHFIGYRAFTTDCFTVNIIYCTFILIVDFTMQSYPHNRPVWYSEHKSNIARANRSRIKFREERNANKKS